MFINDIVYLKFSELEVSLVWYHDLVAVLISKRYFMEVSNTQKTSLWILFCCITVLRTMQVYDEYLFDLKYLLHLYRYLFSDGYDIVFISL